MDLLYFLPSRKMFEGETLSSYSSRLPLTGKENMITKLLSMEVYRLTRTLYLIRDDQETVLVVVDCPELI